MTRPVRLDHVCWSYDDAAAFEAHARSVLEAGLTEGRQVWFVSARRPAGLIGWLGAAGARPGGGAVGPTRFVSIDAAYPSGAVIDPAAQVDAYAAATEEALAAGYTGLRVVADATTLVRTPAQLDAFARYEHLIDRYMSTRPFEAVCAYRRSELGARTVAELACLHPHTNADDVPFRLHAGGSGDGGVELAGDLDASTDDLFVGALDRADLTPVDGELVFEAAGLRFADHRSLLRLDRYGAERDATVVLRTGLTSVARIVELLELPRVRVEVPR